MSHGRKRWQHACDSRTAGAVRGTGSVISSVKLLLMNSYVVDAVVQFATKTATGVPQNMPWRKASRIYAHWPGGPELQGRTGQPIPCEVDLNSPRPFRIDHPHPKHSRTEAALNELWSNGLRKGAHVDMQDARRFGTLETGAPRSSVITYCRRAGASGLVLWPLHGYHSPGSPNFPKVASADEYSFSEKSDSIAWRGNLTGRALPELGDGETGNEHAVDLAHRLNGSDDEGTLASLLTVPRFRVLSRLIERPDADVGLVLGRKFESPLPEVLERLQRPRMTYGDLYKHRYLLSLSGNDSASNFLMAAHSNSVVLREEDGWESFYDGLFAPWEHYIPIGRGGDDLDTQLEWARAHPNECQEMARRAKRSVRGLVRRANRRAYLNGIREVYESRYKPQ
jgi:hypothetical protein